MEALLYMLTENFTRSGVYCTCKIHLCNGTQRILRAKTMNTFIHCIEVPFPFSFVILAVALGRLSGGKDAIQSLTAAAFYYTTTLQLAGNSEEYVAVLAPVDKLCCSSASAPLRVCSTFQVLYSAIGFWLISVSACLRRLTSA